MAIFAESEQIAFGTGVLVDGLDFSDDKMLVGRTFSYSDTQRYRVGPNYLQLPVNKPKPATSGSCSSTVPNSRKMRIICSGGASWAVSRKPWITPVSWIGKKPFGI